MGEHLHRRFSLHQILCGAQVWKTEHVAFHYDLQSNWGDQRQLYAGIRC